MVGLVTNKVKIHPRYWVAHAIATPTELSPQLYAESPVVTSRSEARNRARCTASLAPTLMHVCLFREWATTRTDKHRSRSSGTSQFGQRARGRQAPHRGPRCKSVRRHRCTVWLRI